MFLRHLYALYVYTVGISLLGLHSVELLANALLALAHFKFGINVVGRV